ncbi:MAG: inositol 2-dehydrogenase [Nitratireductor sp.]
MINVGILGSGRIGQVHAKAVNASSNAKLVAVSDYFEEAAKALGAQYGADVRTSDEILASSDIDAIIICTPTSTHCDYIETGVANNKAVMCEKPVDMASDRIKECLEIIKDSSAPLLVGFNRRFDPGFKNLQARLANGDIGEAELITITSRDPAPPPLTYVRTSGGLFRDMMIHDFDMARFLLNEEPTEVYATGSALVDPEIGKAGDVDTASVILKTASGKICQISNSRRATYGYDQRIEVHGSKGMLKAANIHESIVEIADGSGFKTDPALNFFLERYVQAYDGELQHFLDCIEKGTQPSPNGYDGLRAQMLADAAQQSLDTGLPVKLPA